MKMLLRKNTSNQFVPGNNPSYKGMKGAKKLALNARAGYFSQFCEVGGLATVNKRFRV